MDPAQTKPAQQTTPPGRSRPLLAGTRGSPLALFQTRAFIAALRRARPELADADTLDEQVIRTTGDVVQDRPLAEIGGKGLFAKEIHQALSEHRIDFAVHSLKDLETVLPDGIVLACTLPRADPRDALVLGPLCGNPDPADPFAALPTGAVIGTASVRRQAQLLHARPDLQTVVIRGNVGTRLAKLARNDCAATLLAIAGLHRLGHSLPEAVVLEPTTMVPAAGQGTIGITMRGDDDALLAMVAAIEDVSARIEATAERALLAALDGSCHTPIAAHARKQPGDEIRLTGLVARPDGSFLLRREISGAAADAGRLGRELGISLRRDSPPDLFA